MLNNNEIALELLSYHFNFLNFCRSSFSIPTTANLSKTVLAIVCSVGKTFVLTEQSVQYTHKNRNQTFGSPNQ